MTEQAKIKNAALWKVKVKTAAFRSKHSKKEKERKKEITALREVVKETGEGMQLTQNCKTVKRHLLINKLSSINSAYKIAFIAY